MIAAEDSGILPSERLDVLFVLAPIYVFMKREFSELRLGPGYLVSCLREHGISSRIYNADAYKPSHKKGTFFKAALEKFIRAAGGFTYFATNWSRYYDQVDDAASPIWLDLRVVLRKLRPRIVGISAVMVTVPSSITIAKIIREESPDSKIVIGGPAAVTCREEFIREEAIDFIVLGEGERTLVELACFILGRENRPTQLADIRGIMYRGGEAMVATAPRPLISDLDSIPFPDRDSTFFLNDDGEFQVIKSNADILTSRGCPYPCKFCCAFTVWGTRKTRFRGADNIFSELTHLNRVYGQRSFVFWDDLFTVDRKRTMELCGKIISAGLNIEWVCLARLNTVDAELLDVMKRAGCKEIQIGVESGNDRILKHIGKDVAVAEILDKVSIIKMSGIELGIFLIIGFPSETLAEMTDTLRIINSIKPAWVSISVFTPYPGTDFYTELEKRGRIDGSSMRGDFWYADNNYTGTMSDYEFKRFAIRALKYGDRYNMRRMIARPAYAWKKIRKIVKKTDMPDKSLSMQMAYEAK